MGKKKALKSVSKMDKTQELAGIVDNVNEPSAIYIDRIDLLELTLKEAQAGQLREQMEKFKLRENLLLIEQRSVLASLRAEIRKVEAQYKEYVGNYNNKKIEIEAKMGINFADYGVGDDGKLTLLHEPNKIKEEGM